MKLHSKTKPRLVVYLTPPELKLADAAAKRNGFRNAHRWFAQMVRQRLAELA